MADPVSALAVTAVVAGGAEVGKAYYQTQAAKDKERALDLQAQENILTYQQKQLANLDAVSKVLDRQVAQSTVRGIDASMSPSFNAVQRNTLNIGAKEGRNLDTENTLAQENVDIEKTNVRNTLYGQLFGDVAETAMSFASLAGKAAVAA